MAATLTKTAGPEGLALGMKIATYSVLLDTTHLTAGEAIDISADFSRVHFALCGANDTLADHGYKFDIIHPGAGTDVTSTNVLVSAFWSNNTAQVFANAGGEDLSGVGELQVLIIGI
jgi:hypothetical protein